MNCKAISLDKEAREKKEEEIWVKRSVDRWELALKGIKECAWHDESQEGQPDMTDTSKMREIIYHLINYIRRADILILFSHPSSFWNSILLCVSCSFPEKIRSVKFVMTASCLWERNSWLTNRNSIVIICFTFTCWFCSRRRINIPLTWFSHLVCLETLQSLLEGFLMKWGVNVVQSKPSSREDHSKCLVVFATTLLFSPLNFEDPSLFNFAWHDLFKIGLRVLGEKESKKWRRRIFCFCLSFQGSQHESDDQSRWFDSRSSSFSLFSIFSLLQ